MKKFTSTSFLLASICLPYVETHAVIANPKPRICNEFVTADLVFVGEVIDHGFADKVMDEEGSADYDPEGYDLSQTYRVRVLEMLKGDFSEEVTLYTPNNSARGMLEEGVKNVIFAHIRDGRPEFWGGGNTTWGPEAEAIVSAIGEYVNGKLESGPASIRGHVVTYGSRQYNRYLHDASYLTVSFENSETEESFAIRSDPEGWFEVDVTPGIWRAYVSEPGWTSRPWDFPYDNPDRIDLTDRGCADVQILAIPGEALENWR